MIKNIPLRGNKNVKIHNIVENMIKKMQLKISITLHEYPIKRIFVRIYENILSQSTLVYPGILISYVRVS